MTIGIQMSELIGRLEEIKTLSVSERESIANVIRRNNELLEDDVQRIIKQTIENNKFNFR